MRHKQKSNRVQTRVNGSSCGPFVGSFFEYTLYEKVYTYIGIHFSLYVDLLPLGQNDLMPFLLSLLISSPDVLLPVFKNRCHATSTA